MSRSAADSLNAHKIIKHTNDVAEAPADEEKFEEWLATIRDADAAILVEATARLSTIPGKPTRDIKALRVAITSEVERKNARAVIETMEKLDRSATWLTRVSLALTVVGVLLAAIQVIQAFGPHR